MSSQLRTMFVRPRQVATYVAAFRLAARPYGLSNVFGAAGRTQYATIYHLATATKIVRLRQVLVAVQSASAAAIIHAELVRLTAAVTPATGNPAITPKPLDPADVAVEATCLALPTTGGTEDTGSIHANVEWNMGITGAAPTTNPPPSLVYVPLYDDPVGWEGKPPTMRAGVAEGWAVTFDASAAATVIAYVTMRFTEELP